ncbi:unnamed protein product [Parnassius apollo]|uniref:(apollo) hypothetical protein n=1 Tax=Parnassius apollo TaxID=110799 RepID=A0A8S3WHQ0_PARAO|nr:unnamed protein product [Parnassius apollo]
MAFLMLAAAFVGFVTILSKPCDRNNHTNCTHRHNNVTKPHPDQYYKLQKSTSKERMIKNKESDAVAGKDDWEELEIVREDILYREDLATQYLAEFFVNTDGEITSLQDTPMNDGNDRDEESIHV